MKPLFLVLLQPQNYRLIHYVHYVHEFTLLRGLSQILRTALQKVIFTSPFSSFSVILEWFQILVSMENKGGIKQINTSPQGNLLHRLQVILPQNDSWYHWDDSDVYGGQAGDIQLANTTREFRPVEEFSCHRSCFLAWGQGRAESDPRVQFQH